MWTTTHITQVLLLSQSWVPVSQGLVAQILVERSSCLRLWLELLEIQLQAHCLEDLTYSILYSGEQWLDEGIWQSWGM